MRAWKTSHKYILLRSSLCRVSCFLLCWSLRFVLHHASRWTCTFCTLILHFALVARSTRVNIVVHSLLSFSTFILQTTRKGGAHLLHPKLLWPHWLLFFLTNFSFYTEVCFVKKVWLPPIVLFSPFSMNLRDFFSSESPFRGCGVGN